MEQEKSPSWRLQGLALVYHALQRQKESDVALAELILRFRSEMTFQIAEVYGFRGETNQKSFFFAAFAGGFGEGNVVGDKVPPECFDEQEA